MNLLKESDKRFLNIERKIGLFVLIAVAGIIAVVISIGIQHDLFTAKNRLYFIAENGQGINEGMAVKLSGFKIGKIKKIELDDIAQVKVELSVNRKYMRWIKMDSIARLVKEGVIGDSLIEVTPGSANSKPAEDSSVMKFEREKGISAMVEELKDEIKPVIKEVKEIIHYINDPDGDIKGTLRNVKALSADLSGTGKKLNAILDNSDKTVAGTSQKINTLLDSTGKTVNDINSLLKKVENEVPSVIEKVNKSLENVQKTTEEIRKATEQAAPSIPSIMEKGKDVADDTKEITGSVKKIWPIRSFIKAPEEKILKIESHE